MKPITEEFINKYLVKDYEGTTLEKGPDAWLVTRPAGRKVKIHDYHIDFAGITVLVPGETEHDRGEWQFLLMYLAQEVWGVVSLISLHGDKTGEGAILWMYGKSHGLKVEGPWWPISSTQAQNYFGDQTTMKLKWGGYRLDVGQGMSAVISLNVEDELMVTKVVGGGAILEAAIRLVQEVQGYVIIGGSKATILSSLGVEQLLGIELIPELYTTTAHYIGVGIAIGAIVGPLAFALGLATNAATGFAVYFGVSLFVQWAYNALFLSNRRAKARERGQALKGNHTWGGSDKRRSNIEDARSRGMML